jgi:phosphoribosylanthranilate isomerase
MTLVKICGVRTEADLEAVIEAGADRVGFVLAPESPRHLSYDAAQKLVRLANDAGADAWVVTAWRASRPKAQAGLEAFIEDTPEIGAVQLHGQESASDVADFVDRFPLAPLVKAIGVSSRADLDLVAQFPKADGFLFDARPPAGASRQGGHGRAFDWSILRGFDAGDDRDWTLAGGLTPENVAAAIRTSRAEAVDVSSGVESAPGVKDIARVRAFIAAAKAAAP